MAKLDKSLKELRRKYHSGRIFLTYIPIHVNGAPIVQRLAVE
jgi:hypothetical protein